MNTRTLQGNLDNRLKLLNDISLLSTKLQGLETSPDQDLSWKQCMLIALIHSAIFTPTIGELALAMGSSHQNTKVMLQKLEDKGYVALIDDIRDRRKTLIQTTERSHAFYLEYQEYCPCFLETIFSDFDDETLGQLAKYIDMMTRRVEETND